MAERRFHLAYSCLSQSEASSASSWPPPMAPASDSLTQLISQSEAWDTGREPEGEILSLSIAIKGLIFIDNDIN